MGVKAIKRVNKKTGEELQQYLQFKRRGFTVSPKREKVRISATET